MAGFLSMDSALSGVLSSKRAIDVISHNIANSSNESYSRQRAELETAHPLQRGGHSYGTGVQVGNVKRVRDELLDAKLWRETQHSSQYNKLSEIYREIEGIINEPSGESLRGTISNFNSALQDLANEPENPGAREVVISTAEDLSGTLNRIFYSLSELGGKSDTNRINSEIETTLDRVNGIGRRIASLNKQISQAEASGATPNDLLDERTELIRELSEYIDVRVNKTPGHHRVTAGGFTLVQNGSSYEYSFDRKEPDEHKMILYEACTQVTNPNSGKLKALLDMRDEHIPEIISGLNDFTIQFIDRFNDIHRNGFGGQGETRTDFWEQLPQSGEGIFRIEGLGDIDSNITERSAGFIDSPETVLAGDPTSSGPENFQFDEGIQETPDGTLIINGRGIDYDMSKDTIHDIISRINRSNNRATAYLSAENRLVIKGTEKNDYELEELRDSGLLLEKANLLSVGGNDRIGANEVEDTTVSLATTTQFDFADPLQAEGTLIFESSNSPRFNINYDLANDSLEDIVTRVNSLANQAGSNVAAEITDRDRLRLYATEMPPDPGLEPNVPEDIEAAFRVNDTASQQLLNSVAAGAGVDLQVVDPARFNDGDTVIVSDENGGEETTVLNVDEATSTITVNLVNNYDGGPGNSGAVRREEDLHETRNLLSNLGLYRQYRSNNNSSEFALSGLADRPALADPAASIRLNERIRNNPELIAVSGGDDVDLTGINNTMKGPGDGTTMLELSRLHSEKIMSEGSKTVDQYISAFVSRIGSKTDQAEREATISQRIVEDVTTRVQNNSGVNLDEEMTNLIRHQQVFQASSRVINTVNDMANSILQLL